MHSYIGYNDNYISFLKMTRYKWFYYVFGASMAVTFGSTWYKKIEGGKCKHDRALSESSIFGYDEDYNDDESLMEEYYTDIL